MLRNPLLTSNSGNRRLPKRWSTSLEATFEICLTEQPYAQHPRRQLFDPRTRTRRLPVRPDATPKGGFVDLSALEKLRKAVRGAVFCPGQDGYDAARSIPNAMINRRPAAIARCTGAADVIACVRFAGEHDLLVSVRGGGHSVAGKSVCDDGLVIDLSAMRGIHVNPDRKTVRAETGLTLGEFDRETQAFGLATTLGVVSKTGIAGLTLGGGWGHLHAKYGLALDNVIGADVVTADGRLLITNASQNEDLFWGVRGGSGNFGIVTSLQYRLHELGPVFGGAVFHPVAKAEEVLTFGKASAGLRVGVPSMANEKHDF